MARSEDLKAGWGSIIIPHWALNTIRASRENFSIRLGDSCPVFKSKWGLERVQCSAIKNFELK